MRTKSHRPASKHSKGSRVALVAGDADTQEMAQAHLAIEAPGWLLETYSRGQEALSAILRAPPQVAVLEQELPDGCGIACAQELKARFPEMPVVVLASKGCPEKLLRALLAGATGYVVKWRAGQDLLLHLRKAMEGRFTLCEEAERLLPKAFAMLRKRTNPCGLTQKEQEAMRWLCRGRSDKEIGVAMRVATATVQVHLKHAFKKLDVHDRRMAVEKYLLKTAGGGG